MIDLNSTGCFNCTDGWDSCGGASQGALLTESPDDGSGGVPALAAVGVLVLVVLVVGAAAGFAVKRSRRATAPKSLDPDNLEAGIIDSPFHSDAESGFEGGLEPADQKYDEGDEEGASKAKYSPPIMLGGLYPSVEEGNALDQTAMKTAAETLTALDHELARMGLQKFAEALRELGCVEPAHLQDLDAEDFDGIGMTAAQIEHAQAGGGTPSPTQPAPVQGKAAPAAKTLSALDHELASMGLQKFAEALRELGCVEPADLQELDSEDMGGIGMTAAEIERMQGNCI